MSVGGTGERAKLGELLIAAGLLDEARLQTALAEQQRWNEPIGRVLVQLGLVDEDVVVRALSRQLGLPSCDPATVEIAPGMTGTIGLHLVEQYGVMPVGADTARRILYVATSEPGDRRSLAELGDRIGWSLQPVVAAPSRIERAIRKHYYGEGLPGPEAAPAAPAPAPAPTPTSSAPEWAELRASLDQLERLAGGQIRALRVLVEMLIDGGVIRREDYLARMGREEQRG